MYLDMDINKRVLKLSLSYITRNNWPKLLLIVPVYKFRIKIIPHNKMLLNRKDMPTSRELMRLENEIENKFINAIKNLF